MSHTSQRRGLEKSARDEIIVLGAYPGRYRNMDGIRDAMQELAVKMLDHGPINWLSKNYTDITIPQIGALKGPLRALQWIMPNMVRGLLFKIAAGRSSVITALFDDRDRVMDLLEDLKKGWLPRNREKGYPVSIVLSGLHASIESCCDKTGHEEHTCLYSLGFFGSTEGMPPEDELSLITMCGHGMISAKRIQLLIGKIREGGMSPGEAAADIARPCVCGIVNTERAEEIFTRIAKA